MNNRNNGVSVLKKSSRSTYVSRVKTSATASYLTWHRMTQESHKCHTDIDAFAHKIIVVGFTIGLCGNIEPV